MVGCVRLRDNGGRQEAAVSEDLIESVAFVMSRAMNMSRKGKRLRQGLKFSTQRVSRVVKMNVKVAKDDERPISGAQDGY